MKSLLIYLIQVILLSGILYGYYHFFLRNVKFHRYNRYYLIASFILSITIPLFHIPIYFSGIPEKAPALLQTLQIVSDEAPFEESSAVVLQDEQLRGFSVQSMAILFYILIGFLALGKILFSLLRIRRMISNNKIETLDRIQFINTNEPGTPFSFFHWLFWNRNIELNSDKGQQILRHELFHIRERHSIDLLAAELMTAIGWINPFFHLLKKELKAIHEFLADQAVVDENNKWEYAELLLMQALQTKQSLVHPFFHNQIKRRIAMIIHSSKTRFGRLRKLLVLPVAIIALLLFAFSYKYRSAEKPTVEKTITVVIDAGHGGTDAGAITNNVSEKDIVLAIAQKVKSLNTDQRVRIILTRESDQSSSLQQRTQLAVSEKADLFLSLHINTSSASTNIESGFEVMIPSTNKTFDSQNRSLASILLTQFSHLYKSKMNIEQSASRIWVLENTKCPTALVECGYLSNQSDLSFITNPDNQEKIAKSILSTIAQFFNQQLINPLPSSEKKYSPMPYNTPLRLDYSFNADDGC